MKRFTCLLIFCMFNAMLVTGEELFLLTYKDNIYRYNTKTKETKKIAMKVDKMACDYERNFMYYTQPKRNENVMKVMRMDQRNGDIKTISDKVDHSVIRMGVDQETGNVYYLTRGGTGFLSYTQNYSKTIISSPRGLNVNFVIDIEIHGKGSSKRIYWSTPGRLYRSQINTTNITNLKGQCAPFGILDNGMVCFSFGDIYLANLDGVATESLPNIAITSSILEDIDSKCGVKDCVIVHGNIYFLCYKQVLKVDLTTGVRYNLIPKTASISPGEVWFSICPLTHQKGVPNKSFTLKKDQTFKRDGHSTNTNHISPVTLLPVSTILIIVTAVVLDTVLIIALAVTILKCMKRHNMASRSDNRPIEEQAEAQPSSTHDDRLNEGNVYTTMPTRSKHENMPGRPNNDQREAPKYFSGNRSEECHVRETMASTESMTSFQ